MNDFFSTEQEESKKLNMMLYKKYFFNWTITNILCYYFAKMHNIYKDLGNTAKFAIKYILF